MCPYPLASGRRAPFRTCLVWAWRSSYITQPKRVGLGQYTLKYNTFFQGVANLLPASMAVERMRS